MRAATVGLCVLLGAGMPAIFAQSESLPRPDTGKLLVNMVEHSTASEEVSRPIALDAFPSYVKEEHVYTRSGSFAYALVRNSRDPHEYLFRQLGLTSDGQTVISEFGMLLRVEEERVDLLAARLQVGEEIANLERTPSTMRAFNFLLSSVLAKERYLLTSSTQVGSLDWWRERVVLDGIDSYIAQARETVELISPQYARLMVGSN